uniref:Uncharacterized protein n=1 Tax=Arundo donax TaxID=35708 RepID=A0A0A9CYZ4_ARUDO
MSSGTIPLFSWSLTRSSWSFSGFMRNIPSAVSPPWAYNLSCMSSNIVGTELPLRS